MIQNLPIKTLICLISSFLFYKIVINALEYRRRNHSGPSNSPSGEEFTGIRGEQENNPPTIKNILHQGDLNKNSLLNNVNFNGNLIINEVIQGVGNVRKDIRIENLPDIQTDRAEEKCPENNDETFDNTSRNGKIMQTIEILESNSSITNENDDDDYNLTGDQENIEDKNSNFENLNVNDNDTITYASKVIQTPDNKEVNFNQNVSQIQSMDCNDNDLTDTKPSNSGHKSNDDTFEIIGASELSSFDSTINLSSSSEEQSSMRSS